MKEAMAAVGGTDPGRLLSVGKPKKRRKYTNEYKARMVREADDAVASGVPGALGGLLRRESLHSSHISAWRELRDAGKLEGPEPRRGRPPKDTSAQELKQLRRKAERLEKELEQARLIIDVQKKVAQLLGAPVSTTEEDESS